MLSPGRNRSRCCDILPPCSSARTCCRWASYLSSLQLQQAAGRTQHCKAPPSCTSAHRYCVSNPSQATALPTHLSQPDHDFKIATSGTRCGWGVRPHHTLAANLHNRGVTPLLADAPGRRAKNSTTTCSSCLDAMAGGCQQQADAVSAGASPAHTCAVKVRCCPTGTPRRCRGDGRLKRRVREVVPTSRRSSSWACMGHMGAQ